MRLTTKLATMACFAVNTLLMGCHSETPKIQMRDEALDSLADKILIQAKYGTSDINELFEKNEDLCNCKIHQAWSKNYLRDYPFDKYQIQIEQENISGDTLKIGKSSSYGLNYIGQ
jgi:hypothetical protein